MHSSANQVLRRWIVKKTCHQKVPFLQQHGFSVDDIECLIVYKTASMLQTLATGKRLKETYAPKPSEGC